MARVLLCLALPLSAFAVDTETCPAPFHDGNCLGTSGALAAGSAVTYLKETITWETGMKAHSHYKVDPTKTALFVIDPQKVYSACPAQLDEQSWGRATADDASWGRGDGYTDDVHSWTSALLADPGSNNFDSHSPLCCEKFDRVVDNANMLARAARKIGAPVYVHAHVYRGNEDSSGNCGRLCDFDVLGWDKWPMAWNLWSAAYPWAALDARFEAEASDIYAEKTTYSAMTEPVVRLLRDQGIDTIIITGFMTQFCSETTARHAHDLGFKVIYVTDANDGPAILEDLSGIDENKFVPFTLGVAVADTTDTASLLWRMGAPEEEINEAARLYAVHWAGGLSAPQASSGSTNFFVAGACAFCFVIGFLVNRVSSIYRLRKTTQTQPEETVAMIES